MFDLGRVAPLEINIFIATTSSRHPLQQDSPEFPCMVLFVPARLLFQSKVTPFLRSTLSASEELALRLSSWFEENGGQLGVIDGVGGDSDRGTTTAGLT